MPTPLGNKRILMKEDVDEIVGPLEDSTIAALIATGASRDDLLEAYAWLTADDAQHRRLHREPHGTIAQLCEILEAEIAPPDEP
jgi:hypothetical protein